MTVYKRKRSQSLKWLVALIIFALAVSISWSDVYGAEPSSTMVPRLSQTPVDYPGLDGSFSGNRYKIRGGI